MDIGPSPAIRAAAREIIGSDSPACVIGAIRAGDLRIWLAITDRAAAIEKAEAMCAPLDPLGRTATVVRDELRRLYDGRPAEQVWRGVAA